MKLCHLCEVNQQAYKYRSSSHAMSGMVFLNQCGTAGVQHTLEMHLPVWKPIPASRIKQNKATQTIGMVSKHMT